MPRRRRQRPRRTVRVHTTFTPWRERVPRGRRYLHMRVLPTFFVDTGVFTGGATAIVYLTMQASEQPMTPGLLWLVLWLGLAGGFYATFTSLRSRPDRVIW